MNDRDLARDALTKVPAVTLGFWIIKNSCHDARRDRRRQRQHELARRDHARRGRGGLNGYLVGTAIFGVLLIVLVWAQIRAQALQSVALLGDDRRFDHRGTTLADFATRSIGIGYPGGSLLLFACVLLSLFAWHRSLGSDRHQHSRHADAPSSFTG